MTDFEELVLKKLVGIENRLTIIETNSMWYKTLTKGSIILIAGILGVNLTGVI